LSDRRGVLEVAVKSASSAMPISQLEARVARMFLRFPSSAKSVTEETIRAYAFDVAKFPLWAVEAAIQRVIADPSPKDFAPSSPVLQGECRFVMRPFAEELAQISIVLDADVYHEPSDDERARIKAGFDKLIADLRLREPFDNRAKAGA
jgi:hypothetical protein